MKKGEMLGNMLILAANGHAGQFDLSGRPYILHPLAVMHYLKTEDEELQCIAVGHDLFEDTKVTVADFKAAGMSQRVIDGVMALTKMPGQTYEEYKKGVLKNKDAMLVKKCDLRHNSDLRRLRGVTDKDVERIAKYHRFYVEIEVELKRMEGETVTMKIEPYT